MSIESRAVVGRPSEESVVPLPGKAAPVTVRFWAGARAAAGAETMTIEADTVGDLRAALVAHRPALEPVLEVSSLLVDGRATTDLSAPLDSTMSVEVLPPFAGG